MRELKQCVGGEKKNVEGGLSTLHYTLTLLQGSKTRTETNVNNKSELVFIFFT